MSFLVEKQAAQVLPPSQGSTVVVNCTTSAQVIDLTTFPRCNAGLGGAAGNDPQNINPIGKYIRITAQLGDVYYQTGNNFAQLANISLTAYTTINATTGAVTVNGNECDAIANGTFKDVFITPGVTPQSTAYQGATGAPRPGQDSPCRYVAVLASSNANITARIYQSSP